MENENKTMTQAAQDNAMSADRAKKRGIGAYIGWIILSALPTIFPILGLIVVAVLAFVGADVDRKRFFKADLIIHGVILAVLVILIIVLFGVYGDIILPMISSNY